MNANTTLEDIIISLPSGQRSVLVQMRSQLETLRQANLELEAELTFSKQRVAELENRLKAQAMPAASVPAPILTLQDLIAGLKQQHTNQVDTMRRKMAEALHKLDDPNFDAFITLQQATSRALRPLPKNYEFVDLLALRELLLGENYFPTNPQQQSLVNEFVSHLDGIRQCTKDGKSANIHYDAPRLDIIKRILDMCKTVESRITSNAHITLPPQAVVVDVKKTADAGEVRAKESKAHVTQIEMCGRVYDSACKEIQSIDELLVTVLQLPHFLPEFDTVLQQAASDAESLQCNESVLREGSKNQVDLILAHRKMLWDQNEQETMQCANLTAEVNRNFDEMVRLLQRCEEGFRSIVQNVAAQCKTQTDMALCDLRISELKKVTETEVMKQQKFIESAKFSAFLCNRSKELFRKLYSNVEEATRARREHCDHVRTSSQEQLYAMAEAYHQVITKRIAADNNSIRQDQQALETANRTLMGLVQVPSEMERQMDTIRQLTLSIASAKNRLIQNAAEIQTIRNIFTKYDTLSFLKRDSTFLSVYESQERLQKVRERLDEMQQRVKYVSEVLVEISDPDTRQDYVVQQCVEGLKQSVSDVQEMQHIKTRIEELDEITRSQCASRLKRHRRLIGHFIDEIKEGGAAELIAQEPSIERHVIQLAEGVDFILCALTHSEDMPVISLRPAVSNATTPMQQSLQPGGAQNLDVSNQGGRSASAIAVASGLAGRVFGGKAGGGNLSQVGDTIPNFQENEQVAHTFGRVSAKLQLSSDKRRCSKPPLGIELSNTTALGSIGIRQNTGTHFYCVRFLQSCQRLLVGFGDWNLPLDGYCNSLKYGGCYYLHVGNGTLWCPEQQIERKQYTFEAMGSTPDEVLVAIIDTNERTISFVFNGMNLGVAFRNVNLSRTIYPAFEVFSNGCSFEFTDSPFQNS